MKLMTGNSNLPLAQEISAYLEIPLTDVSVRTRRSSSRSTRTSAARMCS
jgi:hypothetical protein